MKTKKVKKILCATVEFPLDDEEESYIESNTAAGYPLGENLVGEMIKVKSGLYENFLCGWIVSVEQKKNQKKA